MMSSNCVPDGGVVQNFAARGRRFCRRQMQPRGIKIKNEGLGRQPVVPKLPSGFIRSLRDLCIGLSANGADPGVSVALLDFQSGSPMWADPSDIVNK